MWLSFCHCCLFSTRSYDNIGDFPCPLCLALNSNSATIKNETIARISLGVVQKVTCFVKQNLHESSESNTTKIKKAYIVGISQMSEIPNAVSDPMSHSTRPTSNILVENLVPSENSIGQNSVPLSAANAISDPMSNHSILGSNILAENLAGLMNLSENLDNKKSVPEASNEPLDENTRKLLKPIERSSTQNVSVIQSKRILPGSLEVSGQDAKQAESPSSSEEETKSWTILKYGY